MSNVKKKERLYDRCSYRDCENWRIKTNSHLFCFPKADDPRYDIWIQRTGNPRLKNWSAATLRKAGLCILHFEAKYIKANGKLECDAVPLSFFEAEYVENGDMTESNNLASATSSILSSDMQAQNMDINDMDLCFDAKTTLSTRTYEKRVKLSFIDSDVGPLDWITVEPPEVPNTAMGNNSKSTDYGKRKNSNGNQAHTVSVTTVAQYRKRIKQLNVQLRQALQRNAILQKKCKKKTLDEFLNEKNCMKPAARAMVKLQLHCKNAPFADDEKDLAKQLSYYSATAYKRLLKAGCNFPSISTVRQWISEVEI